MLLFSYSSYIIISMSGQNNKATTICTICQKLKKKMKRIAVLIKRKGRQKSARINNMLKNARYFWPFDPIFCNPWFWRRKFHNCQQCIWSNLSNICIAVTTAVGFLSCGLGIIHIQLLPVQCCLPHLHKAAALVLRENWKIQRSTRLGLSRR